MNSPSSLGCSPAMRKCASRAIGAAFEAFAFARATRINSSTVSRGTKSWQLSCLAISTTVSGVNASEADQTKQKVGIEVEGLTAHLLDNQLRGCWINAPRGCR